MKEPEECHEQFLRVVSHECFLSCSVCLHSAGDMRSASGGDSGKLTSLKLAAERIVSLLAAWILHTGRLYTLCWLFQLDEYNRALSVFMVSLQYQTVFSGDKQAPKSCETRCPIPNATYLVLELVSDLLNAVFTCITTTTWQRKWQVEYFSDYCFKIICVALIYHLMEEVMLNGSTRTFFKL